MALAPKPISIENLWTDLPNQNRQLFDICTDEDHAEFPRLILGSIRISPTSLGTITRPAIFICQKGLKLSQGAAAFVNARGGAADYLTGGIQEWHNHGLPTLASERLSQTTFVTADGPRAHLVRWLLTLIAPANTDLMIVDNNVASAVSDKFQAPILRTVEDVLSYYDIPSASFAGIMAREQHFDDLLTNASIDQGHAFWSMVWNAAQAGDK